MSPRGDGGERDVGVLAHNALVATQAFYGEVLARAEERAQNLARANALLTQALRDVKVMAQDDPARERERVPPPNGTVTRVTAASTNVIAGLEGLKLAKQDVPNTEAVRERVANVIVAELSRIEAEMAVVAKSTVLR